MIVYKYVLDCWDMMNTCCWCFLTRLLTTLVEHQIATEETDIVGSNMYALLEENPLELLNVVATLDEAGNL